MASSEDASSSCLEMRIVALALAEDHAEGAIMEARTLEAAAW